MAFGLVVAGARTEVECPKHGFWAESSVISAKCRGQNGGVLAQSSVTSAICDAQNTGFGHNLRLYLDFGVDVGLLLYFKSFCRPVPCGGKTSLLSGIRVENWRFWVQPIREV